MAKHIKLFEQFVNEAKNSLPPSAKKTLSKFMKAWDSITGEEDSDEINEILKKAGLNVTTPSEATKMKTFPKNSFIFGDGDPTNPVYTTDGTVFYEVQDGEIDNKPIEGDPDEYEDILGFDGTYEDYIDLVGGNDGFAFIS